MNHNTHISWFELDQLIAEHDTIMLTTHKNPDGDGLGSEVAFYHYLKSLDKKCRIVNISPTPAEFAFLNKNGIIETYTREHDQWLETVQLTIVFDVGDARRIGALADHVFNKCCTVSIDHHPLKDGFDFNYVIINTDAAATGVILWEYFCGHLRMERLETRMSDALYTALVTDTGSFRYSNTDINAHKMAIQMMESGTVPHKVHENIYEQRPIPQVRLLGEVIRNLKFSEDGKVVYFRISPEMLDLCGAKLSDVDGFTDYARSIIGVEVSFMLVMTSKDEIRINFRSKGRVTVNDIAAVFDGGGHRYAAGATVANRPVDEVEHDVLQRIQDKLKENFGGR